MSDDWWDTLYADDTYRDTPTGSENPGQGAETGQASRHIPDWRHGPTPLEVLNKTDTTKEETGQQDATDTEHDNTDSENTETEENTRDTTPRWDPTAVADHILAAHQRRAIGDRATTTARSVIATATAPRAGAGRILSAGSGIAASWWIGLTPWLIERLDGAPIGVSIGLILIGWSIHRSATHHAAPIRWCAHSLYTCCVIAAFLHS